MSTEQAALRHLNDSGFPLQIALHQAVDEQRHITSWRVRFSEHSWEERTTGESGFIDLVLDAGDSRFWMVVECKRVRDVEWVFLNSHGDANNRSHAKVWVSQFANGAKSRFGWQDLTISPSSPEAEFCALRGQSSAERITLLERTAGQLITATEALAKELLDFRFHHLSDLKIFLSVIVTTATLKMATFDTRNIALDTGMLAEAEFVDVPWVRLRKQLSTRRHEFGEADYRNDGNLSRGKEHTVFVVRAEAFVDFLRDFGIDTHALSF